MAEEDGRHTLHCLSELKLASGGRAIANFIAPRFSELPDRLRK